MVVVSKRHNFLVVLKCLKISRTSQNCPRVHVWMGLIVRAILWLTCFFFKILLCLVLNLGAGFKLAWQLVEELGQWLNIPHFRTVKLTM